jgi:hypothetical protein
VVRLAAPLLLSAAPTPAQVLPPAPVTVPLALPEGQSLIVEHRDERRLPSGELAIFTQLHRLTMAVRDGATLLTYQPANAGCDGPSAICAGYLRNLGSQPGPIYHYRLGADGDVVPLGHAAAPLPAGTTAGDMVQQREAAVPGAVLAADLRLLIRFANIALPAPGHVVAVAEGRLAVTGETPAQLTVQIDRPASGGDATPPLNSRAICQVTRATGLIQRCDLTDWGG